MNQNNSGKLKNGKLSQIEKQQLREKKRREKKKEKRKKKNALVICQNGSQFWTTQNQFWQWVREKSLVKTGNNPLRGKLVKENEEYSVVISNTVLNLACPNHLQEALYSRKYKSA
jgi:hypothetical protein